jgi:pyrroloquinoline-quinone synthase
MHWLDERLSDLHLLNHPFYRRWRCGELTPGELRTYAAQYYPHVEAFPTYVSAVHAQAGDAVLRKALLENLIEEERGEENHPELWLRFGEAVGATRADLQAVSPSGESRDLVATFRKLTRKSLASGLGALYAYESQVPAVAEQKIDGLRKFYGVTGERGLAFFEVHRKADEWHSAVEREAIDRLDDASRREAGESAREAAGALWRFLDGIGPA